MQQHISPTDPLHRIRIVVPWWGLGAMISATTSHLLKLTEKPIIDWWNHWYTRQEYALTNIFNWFYNQSDELPCPIVHTEWDFDTFAINDYRSPALVQEARTKWRWLLNGQMDKCGCLGNAMIRVQGEVLGVHYRGTDKRSEVPMPPTSAIIDIIKRTQQARGLSTVLICTDDQSFLTRCLAEIPGILYFQNHLRAHGTVGIHEAAGSYRQCLETMTEILALGLCRHLLLGRSCVADAALFLSNDSTTWEYYN